MRANELIPESEIVKNAILYLKSIRWEVYRRNVGAMAIMLPNVRRRWFRSAEPGQSDLYGTLPDGRRFELEIKHHGKRPTALQLAWLQSQNDEHCVAFWCDSTATLQRIAPAIAGRARVVYGEGDEYDVETTTCQRHAK